MMPPALKYADIGIAMGKRGSEVSREAADLILMDDNFHTIVETVRDGRRIYDNIRKAVGYVFTIHIPIALASLLAPMLGIPAAALLLLPLHVVLLELIIDPTCSIVLERQPAEPDIMDRKPRDPNKKLLTPGLLLKSILQGLMVFAASFGAYYITLDGIPANAPHGPSHGSMHHCLCQPVPRSGQQLGSGLHLPFGGPALKRPGDMGSEHIYPCQPAGDPLYACIRFPEAGSPEHRPVLRLPTHGRSLRAVV